MDINVMSFINSLSKNSINVLRLIWSSVVMFESEKSWKHGDMLNSNNGNSGNAGDTGFDDEGGSLWISYNTKCFNFCVNVPYAMNNLLKK